jgi:hypothetical protein
VTIAAALLDFPKLVVLFSTFSFVEVKFHLAEESRAAWLDNCSYNAFSLLHDDVGSHGAATGTGISELEILKTVILSAAWELDGVLKSSGSCGDTHSTDEAALLFQATGGLASVLDLVSSVFCEDSPGNWADAVTPMDVLCEFDFAVVFSHFLC